MVSSWENIDASIANFSRCQLYFSFFFSPPVKRLLRLVTLHHAQRQFSMRCKSTYTSGESRAEGKEGWQYRPSWRRVTLSTEKRNTNHPFWNYHYPIFKSRYFVQFSVIFELWNRIIPNGYMVQLKSSCNIYTIYFQYCLDIS